MRSRFHALGSALLLQATFAAVQADAAPMRQDQAGLASTQPDAPVDLGSDDVSLEAPRPGRATSPATTSRSSLPPAAQQASPNPTIDPATGLQIIDEASAAALSAARASARAQQPQTGPRPEAVEGTAGGEGDIAIDPDLKDAAKSALQWMHEAKQLMLPSGIGTAAGTGQEPGTAIGSAPRYTSGGAGDGNSGADGQATAQGRRSGDTRNLIREAIALAKEVAAHPVTWLLLLLVAFGGAAASVLQYRARVEHRWARKRAAHGRRGSSEAARAQFQAEPVVAKSALPRAHSSRRSHSSYRSHSSGRSASGRSSGHRSTRPRRTG